MGTHINCIIPKKKSFTVAEVKRKLETVFEKCKSEYDHIVNFGTFAKNINGKWWICKVPAKANHKEYITGEGDIFSIDIYTNVIHLGCIERFSSLYLKETNISDELFTIISEISSEFGSADEFLIGAGGFGETDHIMDMMLYQNADYIEVNKKMTELHGYPATNMMDLKDRIWFIRKSSNS